MKKTNFVSEFFMSSALILDNQCESSDFRGINMRRCTATTTMISCNALYKVGVNFIKRKIHNNINNVHFQASDSLIQEHLDFVFASLASASI